VQPGPIDTVESAAGEWAVPQKAATALDRYGRVDEVAALVAFVAGPESSYITGRISRSMAAPMPEPTRTFLSHQSRRPGGPA
jgi:NAD(P)-dependent dehydrogenase (short-subunit alcohol dehydrogenase family)